ncbi:unnamed protein product [Clonostachys rosea f. rosea IK726]|jgi:hypothetical protein|uniref:Uncharacterized protein n=1 Tax=Clonostachys rosea f. rosea IK726 TaxID=1349383 RepID=A0ACA9TJV3_BIOOC|nr:unnamed protein product [Clonostachys rosea f. rosea IK726]
MSEEQAMSAAVRGVPIDPRRVVKDVGPYAEYNGRNEHHSDFDDDEQDYYFDENDELHFISTPNVLVDGSNEPRTTPYTDDAFRRSPCHDNAFQNHFFDEDDEDDEFADYYWVGQNNGFNEDNGSDEDNAREPQEPLNDNNFALVWLLDSSRWRPHWQEARHRVGKDFEVTYRDVEHFTADDPGNWR